MFFNNSNYPNLCGIYSTGVNSLSSGELYQMHEREVSDTYVWCNERVELICRGHRDASIKRTEFYNPPPLVCSARIHNRQELLRLLGYRELQNISDEELFFACYREWGVSFADKVLGEWTAALWDEDRQQLVIATSHLWGPKIYYCQTAEAFYFGTSLSNLMAHEQVPKQLNEFRLGQLLIGWNDHYGETLYKEVHVLGPARVLILNADGLTIERYWKLEEASQSQIRLSSDEEYTEAFMDIYRAAVSCRIDNPATVGSSLSGGLDSGSVTALAAEQLRMSQHILPAFSSVPFHSLSDFDLPGRFGDESDYARATAELAGNVHVNWIRSEQRSPLQAIKELVLILCEPPVTAGNHYWILSMLDAARSQSLTTLLIGQIGNSSVSWKGVAQEKFFSGGLLRAVKRHLLSSLLPAAIRRLKIRNSHIQLNWHSNSPINDHFAKEQRFEEKMRSMGRLFPHEFRKDPRLVRLQAIKPSSAPVCLLWSEFGQHYDIWVSDATADKRLLEFCLALPNDQFYRDGEEKYLAKRAFANILPHQVLHNRKRGRQAADLQQRLLLERLEMEQIITSFHQSEICNHYLDLRKIENSLSALTQNTHRGFIDTANILAKGLMFGLFLQKLEKTL